MDAVLSYTLSGITYSQTFSLASIRGLDDPDYCHIPKNFHNYLSGTIQEQTLGGFYKYVTMQFKPTTAWKRRFLVKWFLAPSKRVTYGVYYVQGTTDEGLITDWLYDCEHNREFNITLNDEHLYFEWQDAAPEADTDMYCTLNVEITGTSQAVQTFTTGAGGLALMQTGAAYPAFNSATHIHTVVLTPNSSCQFVPCLVGNPSVVGGNVTFQAFISDMQVPAADGKYYMDCRIYLQAI